MIRVTAAIIEKEGKILLAKRRQGRARGKWEFPGGKFRPGETPEECLAREIWEELGVRIQVGRFFTESIHSDSKGTIQLLAYTVTWPEGAEAKLRVHEEVHWVEPNQLLNYDLLPADIPIASKLAGSRGR